MGVQKSSTFLQYIKLYKFCNEIILAWLKITFHVSSEVLPHAWGILADDFVEIFFHDYMTIFSVVNVECST